MPYLNIDLNFPEHPKTRRLIGLLSGNQEGTLLRLWCFVAKYHGDTGVLRDYTPQEIEAVAGWQGDKGKFVEALCRVGFLHREPHGYRLHDWLEHQGHIPALNQRAKKAAKTRWKSMAKVSNAPSNAPSNASGNAKDPPDECSFPFPSLPYQKTNTPVVPSRGFSDFWSVYPSKVGKRASERAWRRLRIGEELLRKILAAIHVQKKSERWLKGFIPNPATWLNQGRWEDEPVKSVEVPHNSAYEEAKRGS